MDPRFLTFGTTCAHDGLFPWLWAEHRQVFGPGLHGQALIRDQACLNLSLIPGQRLRRKKMDDSCRGPHSATSVLPGAVCGKQAPGEGKKSSPSTDIISHDAAQSGT